MKGLRVAVSLDFMKMWLTYGQKISACEIIEGISQDATLVFAEYEPLSRIFWLYFEDSRGFPLVEGQTLSQLPKKEIVIRSLNHD